MTTTVTTVPQTSIASIVVTVSGHTSGTLVALTRTDANGSRAVRLYEDQDLSSGLLVVTDAEAALVGPVVYSATVSVSGTAETATESTQFEDGISPRLHPAIRPDLGVTLSHVLQYNSTRPTATTVHQVIDRREPLVALGVQGARTGVIDLFANTYTDARAIESTLGQGETMMLRQAEYGGLDMYFTALSTEVYPDESRTAVRRWIVRVEFQEISWPSTPLFGSVGWTIAASLARNATLADSQAEFPTVGDLLIGPEVL